MVEAIIKEIDLQKDFFSEIVETVYFGGGTPSILNPEQIKKIIGQVDQTFGIKNGAELTLEANPEDVNPKKVRAWKSSGINRISLGVQTLNDTVLARLNRAHSGKQGREAIEILKNSDLNNISIDLMYGLPDNQLDDWHANLEEVVSYRIPHISAYALTIEKKTVFGHREEKGLLSVSTDEEYEAQYDLMCKSLGQAGYEHYEVSNFARPNQRSQHNQSYWQGKSYLGVGPGAHSFDGKQRLFNISNNVGYIRSLNKNQLANEAERLTDEQQYNEYLLTRLRTKEGINLALIKEAFKTDLFKTSYDFLKRCLNDKLANLQEGNFILTEKGFFVSDAIILELMK